MLMLTINALYNLNDEDKLERITQPGTFRIMTGRASDHIRLQKSFELTD